MTDTAKTLAMPYPWQSEQWNRLLKQHDNGRLPHALLMVGAKGIGKAHLARALGEYLLCLSGKDGRACGSCRGCELNKAHTHPDFLIVGPEDGSRAIKIDQIREIIDFVSKTAQQGGRKVVVLDPAEALNINAANALLKCLEEPSGDTTLILVSHQPSALMATIRSRCQAIVCALPDEREALAWLEPLAVGEEPGRLLAAASGAPLEALRLLDDDRLQHRRALEDGLLAIAREGRSPIAVAAELNQLVLEDVVNALLQWIQQGVRSASGSQGLEQAAQLVGVTGALPMKLLFRFQERLYARKRQLLSQANPNKQLLLEDLLLDWQAMVDARR